METKSDCLQEIRRRLASGNADDAQELARRALERWPDDESLICLMARAEEGQGRGEAARERLEAMLAQHPDSVEAHFELARLLVTLGRGEEARSHLKTCLSNDTGHAPAWTLLARLDRQDGRRKEAISGLKTALRADADHVPALVSLAELLLEFGEREAANEHASRAVQLQPEDALAQLALARVLVADGMLGFAEGCLSNAVRLAPDSAYVRNVAGHLYSKMGQDRTAAENLAAARSLGLDEPSNVSAFAASLARMGRVKEARSVAAHLSDDQLPPELIRELAEAASRLGDSAELEAVAEFLAAREGVASELRSWTQALQAHARGEWQQALELVEPLIDSDDLDLSIRARIQAARSSLRAGHAEAAISVLEPLVADKRLTIPAHWELAALLRQARRPEQAIKTLKSVLERRSPGEEQAALTRARLVDLLDRNGDYEEASELLEQAGWQPPHLGDTAYLDFDEDARRALIRMGTEATRSASEHSPRLVFVTGWPCEGRDLVVAALGASEEVAVLPLSDWWRRRSRLTLPVDPARHADLGEDDLARIRRAYLRGFSGQRSVLEPAFVQALELPLIARLFPDALVVHPQADPRYLKLQWRLLGYRQVPSMFKAWQREADAMAAFRESGAMQVLDCPLEALIEDPAAVLDDACEYLGILFLPTMADAAEAAHARAGYRAPDHWRHYERVGQ